MIKVAIDSSPIESGHKVRGVGFYANNLINALGKGDKNVSVEAINFSQKDLKEFDVAHYLFFNPFYISFKLTSGVKTVVTIHDLTPLVYPKHYPPGIRGKIRFLVQKMMLKKVSGVITDTEASKKDIVRFLGIKEDKINVVHLAPQNGIKEISTKSELNRVKKKYKLPEKFVLYVGDVNYNKNLHVLVHACKKAELPLVIVGKQALEISEGGMVMLDQIKGPMDMARFILGKPHPENAHYARMAHHFKNKKNKIKCVGFIPASDLTVFYSLASLYCQPSLYEGFGLPLLEAMKAGCPVVASQTQALVEVGGKGAVYFDPKSSDEAAKKIRRIVEDKSFREKLKERGRENLRRFSWEKTATETLEVYRNL